MVTDQRDSGGDWTFIDTSQNFLINADVKVKSCVQTSLAPLRKTLSNRCPI